MKQKINLATIGLAACLIMLLIMVSCPKLRDKIDGVKIENNNGGEENEKQSN